MSAMKTIPADHAATIAAAEATVADHQREIDRLRELPKIVAKHTTKAYKAAGRIAESVEALQEALSRVPDTAQDSSEKLPDMAVESSAHPARTLTAEFECEASDLLTLWRAALDRIDAGKGEDDAPLLLSLAPHVRAKTEADPPAVLTLARAAAVVGEELFACGYEQGTGPALRDLSAGIVTLLEETLSE